MLITVQQAADLKDVTRRAVYDAIEAGKLTKYEEYGKMLVDQDEVGAWLPRNYRERKRGPGRPKGRKNNKPIEGGGAE